MPGLYKKPPGRPPNDATFASTIGEYINDDGSLYVPRTDAERGKKNYLARVRRKFHVDVETFECRSCLEYIETSDDMFACCQGSCQGRMCPSCWCKHRNAGSRCGNERCICACAHKPARCPICRAPALHQGEAMCTATNGCVLLACHPGLCIKASSGDQAASRTRRSA